MLYSIIFMIVQSHNVVKFNYKSKLLPCIWKKLIHNIVNSSMIFCHITHLVKLQWDSDYEVMKENKLFTLTQLIALRRCSRSDVNVTSIVEQLKQISCYQWTNRLLARRSNNSIVTFIIKGCLSGLLENLD